jgi:hypothetical protein
VSTEYLEISFCVLSNVIEDRINNQIIDEIIRISPNIIKITHSQGTNTIEVLAVWEEFEIDRRIEDMRTIANVSNVLAVRKKFVKNIKESISISDSVSWSIKRDPVENIRLAEDAKDYYKALSLACKEHVIIECADSNKTFKCFYCSEYYSSEVERVKHIESKHQGKLYYPTPEEFRNRLIDS